MNAKRSEKIIGALLVMALGILLIVMKNQFIGILMTVAGVSLILLGVVDIFNKCVPPSIIKIVSGALVIICGWVAVRAVLYIVSAVLLIGGILLLYDKIKNGTKNTQLPYVICEYAKSILCIVIGVLFLFHRGTAVVFVFNVGGSLALLEGGVLLIDAFSEQEN